MTREDQKNGATGRERVRYGVVGLGWISQSALMPAFDNAKANSELVALFSDTPEKLDQLGDEYGVTRLHRYDEFDAVLGSGAVDAIYIGLPNHLHAEYTIRAARAGVHVLCEKPMAVTDEECEAMVTAAEEGGVKLMIAYRLHFEPANLHAISLLQKGKIGDPRVFHSLHTMDVEAGNIRLDPPEKGGGPVYDIGVYCINAARYLFQDEPLSVTATFAHGDDPRFTECESAASVTLRFPNERLATFTCGFGTEKASRYTVVGAQGMLTLDPAYSYEQDIRHELTVQGKTRKRTFKAGDQFGPQLSYFSDCVLSDQQPEPSGHEGWNDVRIIRAIHQSAATGRTVPLELAAEPMPDQSQTIRMRPVKSKPVVLAEPPGG
jgi:glucose-fructose oxidoreductase